MLTANEIKRYGKYRTAKLVLQAWDRLDGAGSHERYIGRQEVAA